jgi:hypothetical protein
MRCALVLAGAAIAVAASAQSGFRVRTVETKGAQGWTAKASFPEFTQPYPLASLASRLWRNEVIAVYDEFIKNARAASNLPRVGNWTFEAISRVSIASSTLVTGYTERFDYSGGAHPNTYFQLFNLILQDGKVRRIGLRDLTNGEAGYQAAVRTALETLNAMKRQRGLDPIPTLTPQQADMFVITPAAMTWMFQPYEVGAYVEGAYVVKISWSRLKSAMNPDGPVGALAQGRRP